MAPVGLVAAGAVVRHHRCAVRRRERDDRAGGRRRGDLLRPELQVPALNRREVPMEDGRVIVLRVYPIPPAIQDGIALLTWQSDTFAYAESFDEVAGRYRGLRVGEVVRLDADNAGLLVKPDVARKQIDGEAAATGGIDSPEGGSGTAPNGAKPGGESEKPEGSTRGMSIATARPHRFHGTVSLEPTRVGRDASRIADEVIAHLVGQVSADVTVTLEIEAILPDGASEQIVRTVTENSRTLKFTSHGFEAE